MKKQHALIILMIMALIAAGQSCLKKKSVDMKGKVLSQGSVKVSDVPDFLGLSFSNAYITTNGKIGNSRFNELAARALLWEEYWIVKKSKNLMYFTDEKKFKGFLGKETSPDKVKIAVENTFTPIHSFIKSNLFMVSSKAVAISGYKPENEHYLLDVKLAKDQVFSIFHLIDKRGIGKQIFDIMKSVDYTGYGYWFKVPLDQATEWKKTNSGKLTFEMIFELREATFPPLMYSVVPMAVRIVNYKTKKVFTEKFF